VAVTSDGIIKIKYLEEDVEQGMNSHENEENKAFVI
jgi:hypothetical protein